MTSPANKSFILHLDSLVILEKLSNEQAGILFNAIYQYQKTGKIISLDFALDLAFTPFLNQFLRDNEKYKITCERRREAGSKGGKQKVANASKSKQKLANLADSDSKNDSDSDSDSKNDKKEISSLRSDIKKNFIKPTLQEIQSYCQERKNSVNPEKWLNHYESNGWKVGKNPMKDWKAAVRTWESNSTREVKNQPSFSSFAQEINRLIGQDLIQEIRMVDDETIVKFVSLSARDKWSKIDEAKKDEAKSKIKAKFNNKIRVA